jgi:hypothetical protein
VALLLEAFLGRPAIIHSMYEVLDPATIPPDVPAFSDGLHLYVRPALSVVGRSPYSLYKLVALHAVAHERFGSFEDQGLAALLRERPMGGADEVSEYDRFFVGLAEDVRIDAALFHTLPGLRRDALTILEETYADFRADGPLGGVPLTPDSLRAHLAGAPFGVRLLADGEVSRVVEDLVAPLTRPGVTAAESTAVGEALHRYLGPRLMAEAESWGDTTSRTAADVPYPPYHDHFFLGLKLSTVAPAEEGTLPLGSLIPGTGIDLPGSLHPSELIAGLEITVRDKQQEADLLILDEEEEEDEDDSNFSVFGYDEWDHELGDYRSRWCTVRCRDLPPGDPKFVPETVARYMG